MNTFITIAAVFILAIQYSSADYIRFVNNINPETIVIETTEVGEFTLDFQQVSDYTSVSSSSVSVVSIKNLGGTGYSYTSTPILVDLTTEYTTVIATFKNGEFYLVLVNETNGVLMTSAGSDRALIRMIDCSSEIPYISVNANSNTLWTYVTYLQATPFAEIDASSVPTFQISESGTSNTYAVSMNNQITANNIYTIFFFEQINAGPQAIVYFDHAVDASDIESTGSDIPSSAGSTSDRAHHNSAGKNQIGFGVGLISVLSIFFFAL